MIKQKKLDKLFIIIFILIIIFPNIGFFKKANLVEFRLKLNRDPYKLPVFKIKSLGQTDFNAVELWYADKILFVAMLSKIWSNLNYYLGISTKPSQVIIGKNDWLFLGNDYAATIDQFTGKNLPSHEEIMAQVKAFNAMYKVTKKYHIPFIVVVVPDKQDIYEEYLPNYLAKSPYSSRLDILAKELPKYGVDVIDLRAVELKAKSTLGKQYGDIYLKGDSHWNYLGAYAAYQEISKHLSFYHIPVRNYKFKFISNITNQTDLTNILQYNNIYSNAPFPDISIISIKIIAWDNAGNVVNMSPYQGNPNKDFSTLYENINLSLNNSLTCLLISDSFSRHLEFYFHNDFRNTVRVPNNSQNYSLEKLINKYHPDVVIFETVERSLIKNQANNFTQ